MISCLILVAFSTSRPSIPTHIFAPPVAVISGAPAAQIEQGFGPGAQIGVFYDPMIANLVVHGTDRTENFVSH
jgi:3-methylcrotonyl-CoA carboxylase alpha subunit